MMIYVLKANGTEEKFNPRKVIETCIRSGTSRQRAEEILAIVKARMHGKTTSHSIYRIILDSLDNLNDKSSFVYRLRESIADMDSISFEIYVKKILKGLGYKTTWNHLIQGRYVEHQVDVTARKDGKMYMIECKRHFNPHRFCSLGVVLQVKARFDDIRLGFLDGMNKFDFYQPWIFNNTKFSAHAIRYGEGAGVLLSGWGYKGDMALDSMINKMNMFPVTILKCDIAAKKRMMEKRIITVDDIRKTDMQRLDSIINDRKTSEDIFAQVRKLDKPSHERTAAGNGFV